MTVPVPSHRMTRDFDLGDILSVTTGRLVSPRHMDGIYDILNHMTGDNLMTHQLPRALDLCQGPLLAQHPDLAGIVVPRIRTEAECETWLVGMKEEHGETRPVAPLAEYTGVDPIEEACDIVGADRVWVVLP